jgi:hypothetical protein
LFCNPLFVQIMYSNNKKPKTFGCVLCYARPPG